MSIFMQYEGMKGESSDKNHKDWTDIETLEWGVNRFITSNTATQGDRESANAVISDLKITKYMDKSSPKVFIESCCGTGKDVKIHMTKTGAGGGADTYMEYTLKNALISHYSVINASQSTRRPLETITISFVEVEAKYTAYDEDGNPESPIANGFNTATNTKK